MKTPLDHAHKFSRDDLDIMRMKQRLQRALRDGGPAWKRDACVVYDQDHQQVCVAADEDRAIFIAQAPAYIQNLLSMLERVETERDAARVEEANLRAAVTAAWSGDSGALDCVGRIGAVDGLSVDRLAAMMTARDSEE